MRLYFRHILIFLIINNKWVLVESSESSATPPPSSGGDGTTVKSEQDSTATLPTAGGASPDGGTEPETKTGVELSLKKTTGTNEFDYKKDGKIVTYTAKDKYAFKSVKTKTGGSSCGSSCGGSEVGIWDAKDANEYASKVVLYGKGQKDKIVTIHMPNDTKKSYKKDKNNPWSEYTGPLPSSGKSGTSKELNPDEYPKEIKLFKADPNDANNPVELATRDYKYNYDAEHVYEFNDGVNCTLVKRDDKEVWKHDSSKHSGKYPKSLTYNNKDFKIILIFTDLRIVCEKDGDSYKATEYKPKTAVQLDIKQSSGTDKFDYIKENNIATFTAKDNYGFKVVRCKNMDDHTWVNIWNSDNEYEYSKKVVLEGDNKLTIHIGDDTSASTKVFNKVGYCKWKEDTQDSTKKSGTGGSGGGGTDQSGGGATQTSPTSGGGTTGTDGSGGGGTDQSGGGATQTSPTSGGGTTGTDGSGGGGTPASPTSGGGTTGTDGSGGGGTQQSTPVTQ